MERKSKLLSPKLDIVFQILFGEAGSEKITKDLLSAILDEEILDVDLSENIVFRRESPDGKMGIVDVLAKINNNEYCNIEMQVAYKSNMIKRMLYYWARQYVKNIKKSEKYSELKRTIGVLIANFEIEELKEKEFHSKWKIRDDDDEVGKIVLTDDLEFHIIELPKLHRKISKGKDKKLEKWMHFLENPESKEVQEYMKENENMKNAKEKLYEISEDAKMQRIAELREKAILDENEARETGYLEGKEEGIKAGIKEGRKEGIKEGERIGEKKVIKKLKEAGMKVDEIVKITGISKEEIDNI